MIDRDTLEEEIIKKQLTAPRITPADIDNLIVDEMYYVFPNTTLTICCLILKNGFTVTGEAACVSPENFNAELGRKTAKLKAKDKIWGLEGYLLHEQLYKNDELNINLSRTHCKYCERALIHENDGTDMCRWCDSVKNC